MPTETTASLLAGPSDSFFGGDVFNPTAVALLREGFRATWALHPTTVDAPFRAATIRPESPDHLLAVGLLGYAIVELPQVIANDDPLMQLVQREDGALLVKRLDRRVARRVFARLGEFISGAITVLPGCTTTDAELAMAETAGFLVAEASRPDAGSLSAGGAQ
jgi:hypothetical protein